MDLRILQPSEEPSVQIQLGRQLTYFSEHHSATNMEAKRTCDIKYICPAPSPPCENIDIPYTQALRHLYSNKHIKTTCKYFMLLHKEGDNMATGRIFRRRPKTFIRAVT